MTGPDLRALFRSNLPEVTATAVFADREDEWASVTQAIAAVVGRVRAADFDVEDLETPRRNVLVFYGMGGIGKTTLSRRVADHLRGGTASDTWSALDPALGRILPVRIDLSSQSGLGFESVMVAVRVALASLGRGMPAFDLAFNRYWAHTHPGESLAQYLRRSAFLSRFPDSRMSEQMQQALADTAQALAMPGTIGTLVSTTLTTLVRALRERRSRSHALAGCRICWRPSLIWTR